MLDVEGAEYALFDDVEFFNTYKPIILVELHIKFLNSENYNRLINGLNNLKHLYCVDTDSLKGQQVIHRLLQPMDGLV
jgi:hypothetical protein